MACSNCNPPMPVAAFVFSGSSPCTNCDESECPQGFLSSKCVFNDGPALTCIGAEPNERLDTILAKIDAQICEISGGNQFPTYNTYCLGSMASEQQFVETISQRFCSLSSDFTLFTGTTFPDTVSTINDTITALDTPNISSCAAIGFDPGDTLSVAITKLANFTCGINDSLDLSTVDWTQCAAVSPIPQTIQEGFDFVIDQLCNITGTGGAAPLPTFNNIGTCLDSPGANDSLVNTIIKIRSRLCTTPSFNPASYTTGCIQITGASTLDQVLQALITELSSVMQDIPREFDNTQFTVEPINVGDTCLGNKVSLTGGVNTDRFVAVDNADSSPGTLVEKLTAGTGIAFDTVTNPGEMILNVTSVADEKVKSQVSDPTPGYLADKMVGTNTAFITTTTPVVSNQVQVNAALDINAVAIAIMDILEDDAGLKDRLCALIATCPSPCSAPTNVSVQYVP